MCWVCIRGCTVIAKELLLYELAIDSDRSMDGGYVLKAQSVTLG